MKTARPYDTKVFPFELDGPITETKADDGSTEFTFSGHAATFGNVDRGGDVIVKGAFKETIPQFLESGFVAWQHDWENPIGSPVQAREDRKGLFVTGTIVDTSLGVDAIKLLRKGVVKKMSIGYRTLASKFLLGDEVEKYITDDMSEGEKSRLRDWGIRELTKLELFEFSPVSMPMNPLAGITATKDLIAERGGDTRAVALAMADIKELLLVSRENDTAPDAQITQVIQHLEDALAILQAVRTDGPAAGSGSGDGGGGGGGGSPPTATAGLGSALVAAYSRYLMQRAGVAEQQN